MCVRAREGGREGGREREIETERQTEKAEKGTESINKYIYYTAQMSVDVVILAPEMV